ncbi:hypothetical protein L1887_37170 [Cichorium endivia]|nr:hypothetical protein L1887_37170 [Cichorium endivia]
MSLSLLPLYLNVSINYVPCKGEEEVGDDDGDEMCPTAVRVARQGGAKDKNMEAGLCDFKEAVREGSHEREKR